MTPTPSLEERLAAMEAALSALIARVSRLEHRLAPAPALRAVTIAPPAPPAAASPGSAVPGSAQPVVVSSRPAPTRRPLIPSGADLEALVGRYGAIGFALVALLAGVGTFISWAV